MFGGIEIKPDDGFQFIGELRVVADLKGLHQMPFEAVRVPNATHRCLTHTHRSSHGAGAPVSGRSWLLLGRLIHDLLHLGRRHGTRPAWPRSVLVQSCDATA